MEVRYKNTARQGHATLRAKGNRKIVSMGFHADVQQATPAWTNTNRVNKANQFTPRPVQLVILDPNLKDNVNSGSVHVNSGTQIKSGSSRFNTGKQNVNSGSVHVNTARVNRPVSNQTSNKTSPKLSQVNLKSPKKCFSKQRSPVNRPFSRNTAHKSNKYAVKGKMGTAVKTSAGCVWRKVIPLSNTNSGPTPDSNDNDHPLKHMEHRGMLIVVVLAHTSDPVPATGSTSGNIEAIFSLVDAHEEEVFSNADDDEMPEIRIYDKSSEGIFEKASYDDGWIITDFNNLQIG
ncbi:hypothetical protein Tco_1042915 [Tanacetum coccineum]|uniref:Uncharacterized protein n=1 Tax=Tanacetum coccineum TaxID=301880 RepID=A0ABQ5GKJ7_9ASTR